MASHSASLPLLSVVVPCFNEEQVIAETYRRLAAQLAQDTRIRYEIIFINDGSADNTLNVLRGIAAADPAVRIISFSRNFGHQLAVTAGIDAASGDAVALIDADLQDPPEILPEMVGRWLEGYEVVYGQRTDRDGESPFKIATASWFYRILNRLSEVPIPLDTGDFRIMDRKVVEVLKHMPERDRFIRGMVSWVGFRQIAVPYHRAARYSGESKYPLMKMLRFALDGLLSFSSQPLRLATGMGFACSFIAVAGILYAVIMRIVTNLWVPGWTALFVAVMLLVGIQLICFGILGEYIGRIYAEIKHRPLYVIAERIGFDDK